MARIETCRGVTWIVVQAETSWNRTPEHLVTDPVDQPVFAVLGVAGILLMILFRPRKPLIGYSRD